MSLSELQMKTKLSEIGRLIDEKKFDDVDILIDQYIKLAKDSGVNEYIANGLFQRGNYEYSIGNPMVAIDSFREAIIYYEKIGNLSMIVDCYNDMGNLFNDIGEEDKVLECYFKAYELINDEHKYTRAKAMIACNIGVIYYDKKDYTNALRFYLDSYALLKSEGIQNLMPLITFNIGVSYFFMDDYTRAKPFVSESLDISKKNNNELDIQYAILGNSLLDFVENHDQKALEESASMCFEVIEKTGFIEDVVDSHKWFIMSLKKLGLYSTAIKRIEYILPIVRECNMVKQCDDILKLGEEISRDSGDIKKAYEYLKERTDKKPLKKNYELSDLEIYKDKYAELNQTEYVDNLKNTVHIFKLLAKLGEGINLNFSSYDIFQFLVEQIYDIWELDVFGMAVQSDDGEFLDYYYHSKKYGVRRYRDAVSDDSILMNYCINNNKEIVIHDTFRTENYVDNFPKNIVDKIHEDFQQSMIFMPMVVSNKALGGLTIQSKYRGYFTSKDIEIVRILASYCLSAVVNYKRHLTLEQLKNADGLTGVGNRHALEDMNERLVKNVDNSVLLGIYDIDYFKGYNDSLGHIMGDQCLIKVTKAVETVVKNYNGKLYRYGGDEFIIIAFSESFEKADELLSEVMKTVERLQLEHPCNENSEYVTISMGSVFVEEMSMDVSEYYQIADELLYDVKEEARGKYKLKLS